MITYLKYLLKFTSTGKTFSNEIYFKPGLTVITGRNEGGKSLILEMIEYGLFGVGALRGVMADYETIQVTLHFDAKGKTHKVIRNGSSQTLNATQASGASAVNRAILGILGINLDVFQIACSAKQGELDRLTARMQPTERRKMVDKVIGLDQLEVVEKQCRTEAASLRKLKDNLTTKLVEPFEPQEPDKYECSTQLDQKFREQLRNEAKREQLLKITKPTLPPEPIKGIYKDDVTDYESLRLSQEFERIGKEKSLQSIPTTVFTRSDIQYATEYYNQQRRGQRPSVELVDLERWYEDWHKLDILSGAVQCPSCGTKFDSAGVVEEVQTPPISRKAVEAELGYVRKWADFTGTILHESPKLAEKEIKTQETALAQAELRNRLQKEFDALPIMNSRADELKRKVQFEKDSQIYQLQLRSYLDKLENWSDAVEELNSFPETDITLEKRLKICQTFEEQKRRYDANILEYETAVAELGSLNDQTESFTRGAECLKFVRSQVKQHLVPSLNKVASHLLKEMTNGQRKTIVVDEEFEVSVDGQPVRTLSGSGISVVNLALRIALGQVLTHSIIPIFLADEIDKDLDDDRAKATHEAIKNLTGTVKQIIVVSHKSIEGDNYIGV